MNRTQKQEKGNENIMPVQAAQINSGFESKITHNFIKAGLESNRIVALYKAVGVIATSSILIVTHTTTGLPKSVVFLSQGDLENATSEITKGLSKSTHSIVTIFQVTIVALYGLAVGAKAYQGMDLPTESKTRSPENSKPEEPNQEVSEIQHPLAPIIQKLQATITAMQQELETQKTAYAQLKKAHESDADQLKKDCLACVNELEKEIATKNQQIEHLIKVFEKHLGLFMSSISQSRLEENEQRAVNDQYSQESFGLDKNLKVLPKLMESFEQEEPQTLTPEQNSPVTLPSKINSDSGAKTHNSVQKKVFVNRKSEDKENLIINSLGGHNAAITT